MNITANGTKSIREVQEEFNLNYPYLKIEFYKGLNDERELVYPESKLQTYRPARAKTTKVVIKPQHTIEDLRDKFYNAFELVILILTQSGTTWTNASKTDYWSIEYQNEHAERLNRKIGMFNE